MLDIKSDEDMDIEQMHKDFCNVVIKQTILRMTLEKKIVENMHDSLFPVWIYV